MHSVTTERTRFLVQVERLLELPLFALSIAWLILAVIELTRGLSRAGEIASTAIWIVFIADFLLKFAIAPKKRAFLVRNWLAAISLLLPAFRIFRAARVLRLSRAARLARGVRVAKLLGSMNRGILALRRRLRRQGAGYVLLATVIVLLAGSAGMMAFEREGPSRALFDSYASSLWWTAMLMTTVASEFWPRTGAGRALALAISLYSVGVFGYITATLASIFVGERKAADAK